MDLIAPYCDRAARLLRGAAGLDGGTPVPLRRREGVLLSALARRCAARTAEDAARLAARWAADIAPQAADWAEVSAREGMVAFTFHDGGWRALRDALAAQPWLEGTADFSPLWPGLSPAVRARRDGSNPAFTAAYAHRRCRAAARAGGTAAPEPLPPGLLWLLAQGPQPGAADWAGRCARAWLALPPEARRDAALAAAAGKALESALALSRPGR